MKITDIALRRSATVIVLTSALVLFGYLAMRDMGVQRTPDVDFPIVAVRTTMTGASATVMDNDVTDVIEERLSTISGIESISSSSYEGQASTVVQFDLGTDIDAAAADVRDRVNLALNELPDEAGGNDLHVNGNMITLANARQNIPRGAQAKGMVT